MTMIVPFSQRLLQEKLLTHVIHDGSSRNRVDHVPREAYLVSRMR